MNKSSDLREKIKVLDFCIKKFYRQSRAKRVRKIITPGSTNSFWKAGKVAMDANVINIPKTLNEYDNEVPCDVLPDRSVPFSYPKIRRIEYRC
jgi:hypothetical protein